MAKRNRPVVAVHRRRTRATRSRPPASETLRYIESSGLLAALLENDQEARRSLQAAGRRVLSALTVAESARALVRARVAGRLTSEEERVALRAVRTLERRSEVVSVTREVLQRVGQPFPVEPVRTLDALHLATIEALGEPPEAVTIVTRDGRIRANAETLGYGVE